VLSSSPPLYIKAELFSSRMNFFCPPPILDLTPRAPPLFENSSLCALSLAFCLFLFSSLFAPISFHFFLPFFLSIFQVALTASLLGPRLAHFFARLCIFFLLTVFLNPRFPQTLDACFFSDLPWEDVSIELFFFGSPGVAVKRPHSRGIPLGLCLFFFFFLFFDGKSLLTSLPLDPSLYSAYLPYPLVEPFLKNTRPGFGADAFP